MIGVVLDFQGSKFSCGHCGAEEALVLPISVTVLVERSDAFLEKHEGCHLKTAYRPGAVTDPAKTTSEQEHRGCVCPRHADRVQCIDLRYHGHSPGPNSDQHREIRDECECVCHSEKEEAERQAEDDGFSAEEPIRCATFSTEAIPADVRAKMDADRAAELAKYACERCRAGDHQSHQPAFAGICIGCTCPWRAE